MTRLSGLIDRDRLRLNVGRDHTDKAESPTRGLIYWGPIYEGRYMRDDIWGTIYEAMFLLIICTLYQRPITPAVQVMVLLLSFWPTLVCIFCSHALNRSYCLRAFAAGLPKQHSSVTLKTRSGVTVALARLQQGPILNLCQCSVVAVKPASWTPDASNRAPTCDVPED